MKILRWIGLVAGVAIVLLLALAGVLYTLFDGEKIKQELAQVVLTRTQRQLSITGPLELSLWPNAAVRLGRTTLSERNSAEPFLAFDQARLSVAVLPLLKKQVVVDGAEIEGLAATLIKHKDGRLNIADLTAATSAEKVGADETASAPFALDIGHIGLARARLVWRDETSGQTATLSDLNFSTGRILADSGRKTLAIGAVKLDFALQGSQGATQLKGQLSVPVAADLATQTLRLEPLVGRLEVSDPKLPMKQLQLSLRGRARIDLAQQTAALELGTQFDASKIDSRLEVVKFAPLKAHVDLAIDRLDVDRYFPPQPAAVTTAKASPAKANVPAPLDFSALKNLDLTGAVRIGVLQVHRLKLAALDARLKAATGRLDIAPFSVSLYQGTASGSLGIDANDNSVALRQRLNNVSIAPLLKDLLGKDVLEGRGNVTLDVNGHGRTVTVMKQTLSGSAVLALRDGAVKGINLAQRLRDLKAQAAQARLGAKQDAKDVGGRAQAFEKTDFAELSATFRIAGGVAHNDDLMLKSPFLRVTGAGDIDLGHDRLDYLAKASVVATSAGQGGKELGELAGITVPVRLSGPFDDLAWKIELGNLVTQAAKEKIEAKVSEKKQEIRQQAGDKVKDKLKGLFGK